MKNDIVCLILACLLLLSAYALVSHFATGYIISNSGINQANSNVNVFAEGRTLNNPESKSKDIEVINSTSVVLVTGDLVHLYYLSDGSVKVAIEPADPIDIGRNFRIFEDSQGLYAIPSDIDLRKYDIDLFNIKLLAKQASITGKRDEIRVILRPVEPVTVNELVASISKLARDVKIDHKVKVVHKELGYVSLAIDAKDRIKIKEVFKRISQLQYDKIWLDKVHYVDVSIDNSIFRPMLDVSVPRIGAEWVWTHAQLSGEGVKIAILDTGIDFTHKDFYYMNGTRKILKAISMVDWPPEEEGNLIDLHGHGTHVSGIATGTGLTLLAQDYLSSIVHPLIHQAGWQDAPHVAGNGTHLAVVWRTYENNKDIWFMIYDGATWSTPEKIVSHEASDSWPWVTILGDGRIIVSWWSDRTGVPKLWYKVYSNGMWTDDKQLPINIDTKGCDVDPSMIQLSNGLLALAWSSSFECDAPSDIYFAILEIDAANEVSLVFQKKISNADSTMWLDTPSILQDSAGNIWIFYVDYEDYDWSTNWGGILPIYFNFTSDMGQTWSGGLLVQGPGYTFPSPIELKNNGTIVLYFSGDDEIRGVPDTLYYMSYYNDEWHGPFKPAIDYWHLWRPSAAYGPGGMYLVATGFNGDYYGNDIFIIPSKPIYQGVAPKANLLVAKVLNKYGWGYESWIISGIEWAVKCGADIISMSLGGLPTDGTDPLSQAVNWAYDQGVLVVVAAGNYGDYFEIATPGAAEKALTVGAVDDHDELAWFTSRGPTLDLRVKPEIVAPGVGICSSVPEDRFGKPYDCWSGTSMSTPHVAGASAIAKQFFRRDYSFEAPPYVLKNWLITFATDDLRYDVYSQGAGRINLTKTFHRDLVDHGGAWIHPAVINFGHIPNGESRTAEFYIEEYAQSRQYNISVEVIDVLTNQDVSGAIEVNPATFSVDKNQQIKVTVTIKSDAPTGLYSGKIKLVDNFGETYHVIFGAHVGLELTIHKIPREGPGEEWAVAGDPVQVVILDPDSELELSLGWQWSRFDKNGTARFILPEGTYEVLTSGWYSYEPAFIAYDNLLLTTSTTITLDERNTYYVTFNPNKPRQVYAETYHGFKSGLICPSSAVPCYSFSLRENRWYPRTANVYYSYSELMWSIDRYVYYPLDDVNPSDPGTITTSTWHDLIYVEREINNPINRIVDYTQLIKKYTEYRTHATPRQSAGLTKVVSTEHEGVDATYVWHINIPYSRAEVVSPDAIYSGFYWKRADLPWINTPYWEYIGRIALSTTREIWGEQPLFPTVKNIDSNRDGEYYDILIKAETFTDSNYYYRNVFHSRYPLDDIEIEVYRDGEPIQVWSDVGYWGDYYIWIEDQTPAKYLLRTRAYEDQILSTETILEYEFTLDDDGNILSAPRLIDINVKDLGLNNTLEKPTIDVEFMLINETEIQLLTFEYSINKGASWIPVPVNAISPDTYRAIFTVYGEEKYVSLRVNATDVNGLKSSVTMINGLLVKGALTLKDLSRVFEKEGTVNAMIVVGLSDPHPPCGPAHTMDTVGGMSVAAYIGRIGSLSKARFYLDSDVAWYNENEYKVYWKIFPGVDMNVITIGGPGVNMITWKYFGNPWYAPVYQYYDPNVGYQFIITPKNTYREPEWVSTQPPLKDLALIELIYVEHENKYVLYVGGFGGFGTWAASYLIQWQGSGVEPIRLEGTAMLIQWIDSNQNWKIDPEDTWNVIEIVQ